MTRLGGMAAGKVDAGAGAGSAWHVGVSSLVGTRLVSDADRLTIVQVRRMHQTSPDFWDA